ncbi:MAG: aminotransferase class III-fold pyridoxal phosphate-dependent enzyme [Candidatus Odinarchaeota archaeon]
MNLQNGISLWNKAKRIIPGGTQLLSKRSEMFLPDGWPSYYKKAKGIEIWDLDDNKFIDMTIMGVGSCILGYGDEDVNNAVKNVIDCGSISTLNTPEEVELAELLIELHPWSEAVRYARTGGEAIAIAVRIARAYSGKDVIAFCGYHGWHDWYLSSNLADNKNLDGHLLPGLDPNGVPRSLIKTAIPFEYNKIEQLESVVEKNDIGVIIVEPMRHQWPKNNFLHKVRSIADEIGAILIFDEVTSGWRMGFGGVHLKLGVNPDIMVSAKAISNGFPMSAILGKFDIMDSSQTSFISSTYWTERIGPVAALSTIRKIIDHNVPAHLDKIGMRIGKGWKDLAHKHGLDLEILPPNPLVTFIFNYENALELKTLFTQEMLKRGYLAGPSVYVSYSHSEETIDKYLSTVDEVFTIIKQALDSNNVLNLLEGPVCHTGFQRLT